MVVPPDISTSAAIGALSVGLLAALHLAVWWREETYPGFGRWTSAMLLFSVAMLAIACRPTTMIVRMLLIGLPLIAASILMLEGCREFRGLRPRLWIVYLMGACVLVFAFLENARVLNTRIIITSSFFAVMAVLCSVTLLRNIRSEHAIGSRFTAGIFAAFAFVSIFRAIYYQLSPPLNVFYDTSWAGAGSFSAQVLFMMGSMFGWRVIADERRLADLKREQDKVSSLAQRSAAADAAKTELITMLSHEVRNPLAGLAAVMELMLDTELTEEQRECAQTVDVSIRALLRITEDILGLSQMESEGLTIESLPFDLRGQVEGMVKTVRPLAKAKGLDLGVEFLTGIPPLLVGDGGRIRQVIMNLVGNALKFTSEGQIRIAVAYRQEDAIPGELQVTVSDTGIGIAPEDVPTLFDKRGAAHASTARAYGGSGIGLALCWSLVNLMGGHLEAESQAGQGSTFRFTLALDLPGRARSAGHS